MFWPIVPVDIFPNKFSAYLFSVVFIVVILAELRILSRWRLKRDQNKDRNTLILFLAAILGSLLSLFYFSWAKIGLLASNMSYLGFLFIFSGFFLRQWSIYLLIPVIFYRIKIEENVLEKKFGEEYKLYKKKTKKLIPSLI